MRVATGIYQGEAPFPFPPPGQPKQSITGLGFSPIIVMISADDILDSSMKTTAMTSPASLSIDWELTNVRSPQVTPFAGLITLDADGFTVDESTTINRLGFLYHWIAFGADPSVVAVGLYLGDGNDDRKITGVGFQPDCLLGGPSTLFARPWCWWFQSLGGDQSLQLGTNLSSILPDRWQGVTPDGFEVGLEFNATGGLNHFWHAWKITPGFVAQASYVGTGSNQAITIGFRPKVVFLQKVAGAGDRDVTVWRPDTLDGDTSFHVIHNRLTGPPPFLTGSIVSLEDNGFIVGTDDAVNETGFTYHYIAFADDPPALDPDRTETDIINDALGLIGARRITLLSSGEPNANFALCFYAALRDDLLRLSHWRFATGRANLAQDPVTPAFEFAFQYTLPSDLIKLREYNGANTDSTNLTLFERSQIPRFKVEGRKLLTNDGEVKIVYTKRITNPSLFDPMFFQTLSTWLASKLADAITKDREKSDSLVKQALEVLLPMAAAVDGQEGSVEPYISDELIRGR